MIRDILQKSILGNQKYINKNRNTSTQEVFGMFCEVPTRWHLPK